MLDIPDILLVRVFPGWPPCVWSPSVSLGRGSSDRSLFLAHLSWGGGGGSVAIGHMYASYSVVVLGFIYCERDGLDSVIVLGFMYCTWDVS